MKMPKVNNAGSDDAKIGVTPMDTPATGSSMPSFQYVQQLIS